MVAVVVVVKRPFDECSAVASITDVVVAESIAAAVVAVVVAASAGSNRKPGSSETMFED